jgi:hypothetical protein
MTGQPQLNIDGSPVTEEQKQIVMFDFSQLKDLWLNVRADVGESSYWSEIAAQQTLTNMLSNGYIDVIQFLERTPDEQIPEKEKLIQELRLKQQQAEVQQQQQAQALQEQQMMAQQQNMEQEAIKRQQDVALQHEKLDIEREKIKAKK